MKKINWFSSLTALIVLGTFLFIGINAWSAGSSNTANTSYDYGNKRKATVAYTWVGDDVDGTVPTGVSDDSYNGWIVSACTEITLSATADYDVELQNSYDADTAGGQLYNRHTTDSECVFLNPWARIDGQVSMVIFAQSDTTSGGIVTLEILSDRLLYPGLN